ncbi:MAG: YIP1 family protein [Bacilli bacterium]|nr:YIP1 family protein [Bacilli bacterium]
MNCPNCGSPVDAGAAFCNGCGANLAVATQQPINTNQNMQQPMNNMNQGMVNNQQPYQNNSGSLNFFKYMIGAIIKPYDTYKENEEKLNSFKNSAILTIVLVAIMTVANLLTAVINTVRPSSNYFSEDTGWSWENLQHFPFFRTIITFLAIYAGILFIIAGVYFLASLIVKKDVKFPKLLGVATTAFIPLGLIVCILVPLLMMISNLLAGIFALVAVIYSIILLIELLDDAIAIDTSNAKMYMHTACLSIIVIGMILFVSFVVSDAVNSEVQSFGLNMIGLFK